MTKPIVKLRNGVKLYFLSWAKYRQFVAFYRNSSPAFTCIWQQIFKTTLSNCHLKYGERRILFRGYNTDFHTFIFFGWKFKVSDRLEKSVWLFDCCHHTIHFECIQFFLHGIGHVLWNWWILAFDCGDQRRTT